jgi:peptidoglycan/xylan/chitin deacetylase (PgdA/CDA1 family)
MRNPARTPSSWLYRLLDASRLPALWRKRDTGLILCYHNVVPDTWSGAGDASLHMPVRRFQHQMQWLQSHYRCVPLTEMLDRLRRGDRLKRLAAVTFDDAYQGVFELALPVLRDLMVPSTVFVVGCAGDRSEPFWWDRVGEASAAQRATWLTEYAGDGARIRAHTEGATGPRDPRIPLPASWDMIRAELGPNVELGAHSMTHRSLPHLDDRDLLDEVGRSRGLIAERTGLVPDAFSYPYGLWNARVRSAVQAAGYKGAVTVDSGLVDRGSDLWALRRINVPATIPLEAFKAWTVGLSPRAIRDRLVGRAP